MDGRIEKDTSETNIANSLKGEEVVDNHDRLLSETRLNIEEDSCDDVVSWSISLQIKLAEQAKDSAKFVTIFLEENRIEKRNKMAQRIHNSIVPGIFQEVSQIFILIISPQAKR